MGYQHRRTSRWLSRPRGAGWRTSHSLPSRCRRPGPIAPRLGDSPAGGRVRRIGRPVTPIRWGMLPLFARPGRGTPGALGEHVGRRVGGGLLSSAARPIRFYVIRTGRVQVLQDGIVLKELGRGRFSRLGLRALTRGRALRAKLVRLARRSSADRRPWCAGGVGKVLATCGRHLHRRRLDVA